MHPNPLCCLSNHCTIRNDYCCCLSYHFQGTSGTCWAPHLPGGEKDSTWAWAITWFLQVFGWVQDISAWIWAQFHLENNCMFLLRETQNSRKTYSQNWSWNPSRRWLCFNVRGGEQPNFGREIHPTCIITLHPQSHLPSGLPNSLEDEIGKNPASHLSCFSLQTGSSLPAVWTCTSVGSGSGPMFSLPWDAVMQGAIEIQSTILWS